MIRALFRVLVGLVFASLVAGLVTVAFVITPAELAAAGNALEARLDSFWMLTLLTATHSFIFAAPFGLIAAVIGEWQSLRSPMYYVSIGVLIAMAGFAAQFSSETGAAASIANNYAFKAFLTAGFFGGLAYWMLAGRSAGGEEADEVPTTGRSATGRPQGGAADAGTPRTGPPRPTATPVAGSKPA